MKSRIVAGAALLLGALGCSSSDNATYPVELEVFVNGKPATGAVVVLYPTGGVKTDTALPTGKVGEGGAVKLSTFAQDDGAPPGEYTVTVEWRDVKYVGTDNLREFSADKLKGKYKRHDSPNAPKVTVDKQPNKLPALQL